MTSIADPSSKNGGDRALTSAAAESSHPVLGAPNPIPSPRAILEPMSPRDKKAAEDVASIINSPATEQRAMRSSMLDRIGDAEDRIINIDEVVEKGKDIDNIGGC
jgi:hypothetical protein